MVHTVDTTPPLEIRQAYVRKKQADIDDFIAGLPKLYVTVRELKELLEYSASLPTGTTLGKRWKNHYGSYVPGFVSNGGKPRWMIGEYTSATEDGKAVNITWYRPVIRVKASSVRTRNRIEQHWFLLDQAYRITGLDPLSTPTKEAKRIAYEKGYDLS